jgi:transposase InsO family protein
MTGAYEDLRALEVPIGRACTLIGRSRATHYRHLKAPVEGPRKPRAVPDNGQALRTTERAQIVRVINSPQYADLAIRQIWARELDEGNYWASMSSMYRIASGAGQNRERRRQATHSAKVKPELLADGPSQVWTWDITKLRGPTKGVWFHLYVLIDIYSRYNPSWIVSHHESAQLAEEFIDEAIARNGAFPHTVHADRGTSMTSGLVADCSPTLASPDHIPGHGYPTTTPSARRSSKPSNTSTISRNPLHPWQINANSWKDSSTSTTTSTATPASAGIPRPRSTSAPRPPSTTPGTSP